MKPCDILLFKSENKLIPKLIARGANSKYSHVAICVSDNMNLAIEAMTGSGVRARDIRKIERESYDIYRIKEEFQYDLNKTISYLVSKLNSRYDYLGVFWLGILKIGAKLGKKIKDASNKWQKSRDYFCSELCYEAFFYGGGLDVVPDVDEADITSPGDIAKSDVLFLVKNEA